jgi:hypothetical protein
MLDLMGRIAIHFGHVVFNEGTGNEQVRVLVAASLEGLEAQATIFGVRLRNEDYVFTEDLEDYDLEVISEVEYNRKNKEAV